MRACLSYVYVRHTYELGANRRRRNEGKKERTKKAKTKKKKCLYIQAFDVISRL